MGLRAFRAGLLPIAVLAFITAACGTGQEPDQVAVTMRIDWDVDGLYAPFYVALEEGFYAEEGLDVDIQTGRGAAENVRVVGSGQAQFGTADAGTTLVGIAEGIPVRVIGGLLRSSPAVIVARRDSGITEPRDLVGLSIGDAQEGSTAVLLPGFLRANGMDMSDINFIGMTFPARVPALMAEQIDVTAGFIQEFVNIEDEVIFIPWAEHGVETYSTSIIANADYLDGNENVAEAFVRASIRGLEWTLDNKQSAAEIVAAEGEGDVDYFLREIELLEPLFRGPSTEPALGLMSAERWASTQAFMVEYGDLPEEIPLDQVYVNLLEGTD